MNKSIAEAAIAKLGLKLANQSLANYWLSLWQGDALPARAQFRPGKLKALLPYLIMFDIVPDESATVRLAGTGFRRILGEDITGRDWLAMTTARHRPVRLRNLSAVARGAALGAHRRVTKTAGEDRFNEEIVLPFAREESGRYTVMAHVDWMLDRLTLVTGVTGIENDSLDFKLLPFA